MQNAAISLIIVAAISWNDGLAQNTITCNAGTGFTGEPSKVTCYFHKDIKVNKIPISVTMVSSCPRREERDVLQCSWKQQSDIPDCILADGYTFNHEVTDRLTVNIPSTTHDHAGNYSCHMVPPNGATVDQCALLVKEKVTEKPISTRKSATLPHPQASSDGLKEILIAILVLLIILILLVTGAIIAYVVNKKKKALWTMLSRLRQSRMKKKNDTKQDDFQIELENEIDNSLAECDAKDSTEETPEKKTQEKGERLTDGAEPLLPEKNGMPLHVQSITVGNKTHSPRPPSPQLPSAR